MATKQAIAVREKIKPDGLTEKQSAFVQAFVRIGCGHADASRAAEAAGYAKGGEADAARRLLQMTHVRAAIRREQAGKLSTLANEAIDVLGAIMRDGDAPAKVRVECAKAVLDRAGFAPVKAQSDIRSHDDDKQVSEMTREELRAILEQAQRAMRGDSAQVIDGEAVRTPDPGNSP